MSDSLFAGSPIWGRLLDEAGLLAAVVAPDGRVLQANATLRLALRWQQVPQGVNWCGLCMDRGDDGALRAASWLGSLGDNAPMELTLRTPAGTPERTVRWHRAALWDVGDDVDGVALIGVDVTQARTEERRAQRSAGFYRALFDTSRALAGLHDPIGMYQAACDVAVSSGQAVMAWVGLVEEARLVPVARAGAAADEYTRDLSIAVPDAADESALRGPSAVAILRGEPAVCNDIAADERMRPWKERATRCKLGSSVALPIRRSGIVVGTLNLYFTETGVFDAELTAVSSKIVSELGQALDLADRDAARQLAEKVARERDLQLACIVETALDAIITLNSRFEIVLFNDAAARMFGVSSEEAIGGSIDRFIAPEFRASHAKYVEAYSAHGVTSRHMGRAAGVSGVRATGETFPIEASISRVGEGDRQLLTVMARDVAEARASQREQAGRVAAEAASRSKTEFLSRISHELRTPLNAVLGFSQLMLMDEKEALNAKHRARVALVIEAGDHLRRLVDEMLDVASIEAGRVAVAMESIDLCELVRTVVRMSEPHASKCGVRLRTSHGDPARLIIRSDPSRLRQVLLNLVSNAIKYSRRGERVRVDLELEPGRVHVVVRDSGIGMTPEQMSQLYQPFNRLGREDSDVPGSGLGLVLVRQLVTLLGGELAIDSRLDEGTTARVTLPATEDVPAPAARMPNAPREHTDRRGVVLYIEDNPVNAMLVEQLLDRWPLVRLIIAPDGAAGLAQARGVLPDVVLLDMQLPDMSGLDVLETLKSDPLTRSLTVVALSASYGAEEVARTLEAGALDYWTKPISVDRFIEGMCRLLPP